LVKREIAEGGLLWLRQSYIEAPGAAVASLADLRPPRGFRSPELERARLPRDAAADEITRAAVLELRKEAQRAARGEINA